MNKSACALSSCNRPRQTLRAVWLCLLLFLVSLGAAQGAEPPALRDFSFVVFGDTRGEAFLPGGQEQAPIMQEVLRKRFQQEGQLQFSPQDGQLQRVLIAGQGGRPDTEYFYRDGRPWLIKQGGKVILRSEGRDWVYRRVIEQLRRGSVNPAQGAWLAVHTGDIPLWGFQGRSLDENPGWQEFYDDFLSALPHPAPGQPGLFFPALGNHETWEDEEMQGMMSTLPYLAGLGFTPRHRIYALDVEGCRFIFLDSGPYKGDHEGWYSDDPKFEHQMAALRSWLADADAQKLRQVFVVYHKPSYCLAGHGPLPQDQSPHKVLKEFAGKLNITVFNGHVHTTEMYQVDGVRYLLLGGGGAPQVLGAKPAPAGYPQELYWRGGPRQEEYSYLLARVEGKGLSLVLHRFRPGDPLHPYQIQKLEMFK